MYHLISSKNYLKSYKLAFTIVELVIAILIFGVGLLAVLLVLNKNISIAKKIQLKTQATFLAKDGIELVYNWRDSNAMKYRPFNFLTGSDTQLADGTYQKIQVGKYYIPVFSLTGNKVNLQQVLSISGARLFLFSGNVYNSAGELVYTGFWYNYFTGKKTPFFRYVMFSGVYLAREASVNTSKILKVISFVKYQFGHLTGKVVLESFMSDWRNEK